MNIQIDRGTWRIFAFVCGLAAAISLMFLFGGDKPTADIASKTGRLPSKNPRVSVVEQASVSTANGAGVSNYQINRINDSIGNIIDAFRKLKGEFAGKELQERQIHFLTLNSGRMHGKECVDLFDEVVSSCADQVVFQAANLLGHRLFAGGVQDGLSALALLDNSPGCTLLALHAGASIDIDTTEGFSAEVVIQVSNASDIDRSVKISLIEGCLQAALLNGRFDERLAKETHRLLSDGLIDEGKLASVIGMASAGTDFSSLVNKFSGSSQKIVRSIYFAWGRTDPGSCAQVLHQEGNVEKLRMHAGALVSGWYDNSPQDAAIWVRSLADDQARDSGASALAMKLLHLSPRESLSWAGSISSDSERLEILKNLKDSILKGSDFASARELFHAGLSPRDLERLGF